ncbi:hypothetical protein [uncultured Aquimarina sp.]|uniref:hypothetical protein n=1 Tax=uncultured Aquimarina sp. TaxID=575652 RepID=UPI00261BCB8C|nr:hypothetical protein [uncultured Aquimarina sp.]
MINYRKIFYLMSCILMLSLVITSCENEETGATSIEAQIEIDDKAIESDPDYLALEKLLINNISLVQTSLKNNNVSLTEYKKVIIDKDEEKMQEIFDKNQIKISENFLLAKMHYESLISKFPQIEKEVGTGIDYNNLSKSEAENLFQNLDKSDFLDVTFIGKNNRRCGWRYITCLLAVGLPAWACVIGGSPTIVVSAACIAGYGAGAILCMDSYCWVF